MTTELETPVGRILWGHPGKAQIKKHQDNGPDKGKPVLKDGKPVEQWVFGVGFSRVDFEQKIWPAMQAEIATGYPQGIPQGFSFKYKDGNSNDRNGKPYALREGYAGCYVLTVSTEAFAPPVYKWMGNAYRQMAPEEYKCGDYVTVKLDMKVNVPANKTHTPGLYVNPKGILHVAYGQEIINSGGDPTEMFGAQPQQHQLPPGASATPLAPSPGQSQPGQSQPGQMQPQGQPGGYQQPGPGYTPPADPRFTGGPQPGQMQPAPGGYQQPAPGGYQQPAPGGYQQPGQPQYQQPGQPQYQQPQQPIQPAHDFVQNAGHQQPGGYAPQPGQMQPAPGGYQQPQPGPNGQYYAPQPGPGQMQPGMLPPNR